MRKPHFGTIDGAIARALEDGEQVVVFRVEDDALGGSLDSRGQKLSPFDSLRPNRTLRLSSAAADMVPRQFGDAGGLDGRAMVRLGGCTARDGGETPDSTASG